VPLAVTSLAADLSAAGGGAKIARDTTIGCCCCCSTGRFVIPARALFASPSASLEGAAVASSFATSLGTRLAAVGAWPVDSCGMDGCPPAPLKALKASDAGPDLVV